MKKKIDLIIDEIAPEKVMYDTDNHSLVVLYPAQEEFKIGDKVRLKKDLNFKVGEYYNGMSYLKSMDDVKDAVLTVECIPTYDMLGCINNIDNDFWCYHKEWLEHIVEDEDEVKFKRGDILASDNILLIFDEYANKEKDLLHSLWNDRGISNINWQTKAFKHATDEQIAQLHEDLRKEGKKWNAEKLQVEDLDISDIVVDGLSACEYLDKPMPNFSSLFCSLPLEDYRKYHAQITLQLIREAWNKHDGFEVNYANSEQDKYFPVLDVYGCIRCFISWDTPHVSVLGLSFPTQERALQFGNQFKDLFKTAMGL